jgi:hypothetical protein
MFHYSSPYYTAFGGAAYEQQFASMRAPRGTSLAAPQVLKVGTRCLPRKPDDPIPPGPADPSVCFGPCEGDEECPDGTVCNCRWRCCTVEYVDDGGDGSDVSEVPSLCPFDTSKNCAEGCRVCDSPSGDGTYEVQCCTGADVEAGDCPYTSQCEIPCTASSQFQGEGVGCMFCGNEGLKACTAKTKPCQWNNPCTANTRRKYLRPRPDGEWKEVDWGESEMLGAIANTLSSTRVQQPMTFEQQQQFMQRMVRDQQLAYHDAQRAFATQHAQQGSRMYMGTNRYYW